KGGISSRQGRRLRSGAARIERAGLILPIGKLTELIARQSGRQFLLECFIHRGDLVLEFPPIAFALTDELYRLEEGGALLDRRQEVFLNLGELGWLNIGPNGESKEMVFKGDHMLQARPGLPLPLRVLQRVLALFEPSGEHFLLLRVEA